MSVLPPEVHIALTQLLQGLQSTDNAVRTQTEEQLNTEWVQQRPDMLLMGLAEQMQGSQDDGVSARRAHMRGYTDEHVDPLILRSTLQTDSNTNLKRPSNE